MTEPGQPGADQQTLEAGVQDAAEDKVRPAASRALHIAAPVVGLTAVAVYAALGVTAGFGVAVGFLIAVVVSQLVDWLVVGEDYVRAVLARAQFGIAARSLTRELLTVVLILGTGWGSDRDRRALAICVLAVGGLRLAYQLILVPVRRRAQVPVEARGIDLQGLQLPPVPHPLLMTRISERTHGLTWVALVGATVAVVTESAVIGYAVTGAVLAVELVGVLLLARLLLIGNRALDRDDLLAAVAARVGALAPEVVLYHSGEPDSAYQANMWLSTMDELPRSSLVVLRERAVMRELAACTTPVLCIPDSVDFMTFPLPKIRVALYTANVGKTIHLLREPGIAHVFIGHGDSDKSASSNPFSKVYSEIWVAGPAGRDRYSRANVGIHDEDIIEVGRPQLSGIDSYAGSVPPVMTVLYAPTWEGWTNDPTHTSVVTAGPRLVERLVSRPDVRLIYKPHPLTGSVSPAAAAADAAMRATITRSGGGHSVAAGPGPSLYDFFNRADVLVADISSVLTDFVESQKPYIVLNLTGRSDEEFRAMFPSASAAYLVSGSATGIDAAVEAIRGGDPMAANRSDLKHYLLGPDEPDAMTRFTEAVDAAYDRAVRLCPVRPTLDVSHA
jgi:hypothetical protein